MYPHSISLRNEKEYKFSDKYILFGQVNYGRTIYLSLGHLWHIYNTAQFFNQSLSALEIKCWQISATTSGSQPFLLSSKQYLNHSPMADSLYMKKVALCFQFHHTALRMAKTQLSFGHSECNKVKL